MIILDELDTNVRVSTEYPTMFKGLALLPE